MPNCEKLVKKGKFAEIVLRFLLNMIQWLYSDMKYVKAPSDVKGEY